MCVFSDDRVFFTREQMILQVMLLTLETERGASLGCRARDFIMFSIVFVGFWNL